MADRAHALKGKPGRNDPCPCGSGKKYKNCRQDKLERQPTASTKKSSLASADINELGALLGSKRYVELESRSRVLLQKRPDVNSGIVWKALSLSLLGQGKNALHALQRAAELLPDDADAHFALGVALRGLRQLNEAMASYQRALAVRPDYAEVHNNLGNILKDLGRLDEAVARFGHALKIKPDYAEAHNNLGIALRGLRKLDAAVASYRRALEINPDFAQAHNNLGSALKDLERPDDAVASFRRALEINPEYAEAHNNLGVALQDLGRPDDAVASFRRALEINPEYAEAHNSLGSALQNLGRLEESAASYRKALAVNPNYGFAHHNLGTALNCLGRLDDAVASFHRALEIDPEYAEAHNDLGSTLQDLGRLEDALASYRKALAINPSYAEAHSNLGSVLQSLGRLEDAFASYLNALTLNPDFAEAHSNLGSLQQRIGQVDEAVASYLKALEISPELAVAHSNLGEALMALGKMEEAENHLSRAVELSSGGAKPLAIALTHIPCRPNDPRFDQLEAVYARRESLPFDDRIELSFAMGKTLEGIGQYDRSFAAYEEGNRLYAQRHPFDEAAVEDHLAKTCSVFGPELFRQYATVAGRLPATRDDRVPVFIVGMPRSGTTLIEQILSSHSAIFGAGELSKLGELARRVEILSLDLATLSALRRLGEEYLDHVQKLAPVTRYFTDKMPANYRHLGLIHMMLPNAKIIHSVRDPMDTCFSCFALHFTSGQRFSYDLGALGRHYVRYKKLMAHWHNVLPSGRIIDVRYEDNIADPEHEARQMLDLLGLPWDPACLKFYENKRTVQTASLGQVRRPIYSSSVARWKRFEKHLGPLLETIGAALNPASIGSDV